MVRVLIVGATGQDGSLLAENFSKDGNSILGITSVNNTTKGNLIETVSLDLAIPENAKSILDEFQPNQIYHLGAVHSSSASTVFLPEETLQQIYACNVMITRNILDWQRSNSESKSVVALSSQMYSREVSGENINESAVLDPHSYYAETKAEAFSLIKEYRSNFGVHVSGAILFNHTSSRSKSQFLFPQLVYKILQVLNGESSKIVVWDPDVELDICDAHELSFGLVGMASLSSPTDIVFARGSSVKLRDLISNTLDALGYSGVYSIEREVGSHLSKSHITGNPEKALKLLNWKANNSPEEILLKMIREKNNTDRIL
jgi:GDPmannose 4,6-dehydratase